MNYYVYIIKISGIIRYVGYTYNLEERQKQHNYLCFKKQTNKKLYKEIRNLEKIKFIKIEKIKTFKSRVEAKRWECYMILKDYFNKKSLWQNVPKITDM